MIVFFKEHADFIKRLILTQFCISIFALSIGFASSIPDIEELYFFSSLLSFVFYMWMVYNAAWESGAKDSSRVMSGRFKPTKWHGFKLQAAAYFPMAVIFGLMLVCSILGSELIGIELFANACLVLNMIVSLVYHIYHGIMQTVLLALGTNFASFLAPIFYFITFIPGCFLAMLGYNLGVNGRTMFGKMKYNVE